MVDESEFDEESDDSDSEEGEEAAPKSGGGKSPNYITPAGAKKLRDELMWLLNTERPKIVETVAWAASNGDRSENADYIYGKRRLREIDRRVRFLQKRLDAAVIVDPRGQKATRVLFGALVTVKDEDEKVKAYQIVGVDEADASNGKVSWNSPFGKAVLQAQVGDFVVLKTPKGEEELEIMEIEYPAEE